MTSLNQHFQNLRKVSSQIFLKVMWSKFHQNRPRIVEMRGCYRQTHTHTDAQTGSPWVNIFSPEMTEYKNSSHVGFKPFFSKLWQHLLIRPVLHRGELSGIPEHSSVRENGPKSSRVKLTLKFGRGSEIRTHGSRPK